MKTLPTQRSTFLIILVCIIDVLFLAASLPLLLTYCGLSIMAFDAPGSEYMWQLWVFLISVWGVSALLFILSSIATIRMIRAKKLFRSILFSALPLFISVFFLIAVNLSGIDNASPAPANKVIS
jgi:hypothetical protein